MGDALLHNGEICEQTPLAGAPFIYQYVRTSGLRALRLARHVELLDAASWRLRHRATGLDAGVLQRSIGRLMTHNRYDPQRQHIVAIRCYGNGDHTIEYCGTSLYEQPFELRSVRVAAITVRADDELGLLPTSALLARTEFLREYARMQGAHVAVTFDKELLAGSVDGATPFAVREKSIIVPPTVAGVEAEQVLRRLVDDGRRIETDVLTLGDLTAIDELFYADHRGITSVASCSGKVYSDVVAHTTARHLGGEK